MGLFLMRIFVALSVGVMSFYMPPSAPGYASSSSDLVQMTYEYEAPTEERDVEEFNVVCYDPVFTELCHIDNRRARWRDRPKEVDKKEGAKKKISA